MTVFQDSMKERDLLAGEAAVKMIQLESKVESDEAEIEKLKALVREAKSNFQALEQSKSSAIAQLEARCVFDLRIEGRTERQRVGGIKGGRQGKVGRGGQRERQVKH